VVGGPPKVEVEVDFGPRGLRGSYFFYGVGSPNDPNTDLPDEIEFYDFYINIDLSDQVDYLQVYQYQAGPNGPYWAPLANLAVNLLSRNDIVLFVDGRATVEIPITDIIAPEVLEGLLSLPSNLFTPQIFCVQATINSAYTETGGNEDDEEARPIAFTFTLSPFDLEDPDTIKLIINFKASEMLWEDNTWQPIDGSKIIHMFLSLQGNFNESTNI
jgi:hypothetical protein